MNCTIHESKSGPGHQIPDRAGYEDLPWCSASRHPRARVYRDPTDLVADHLIFTRMQTRSHANTETYSRGNFMELNPRRGPFDDIGSSRDRGSRSDAGVPLR